ncbi:hypothetical protein OH77DRAFT_1375183, partial [Trametes cingulata]
RPEHARLSNLRDRVRAELRHNLDSKLAELTGNPRAHMSWTPARYAKLVVLRHRYKLVGWPADVPFRNLSSVPGGARPLLALRAAWDRASLRFEPVTAVDLVNAVRDPQSVCPNAPSPPDMSARPRRQRLDVKKARRRPVTNPGNDELRRPKRGVKSARYV